MERVDTYVALMPAELVNTVVFYQARHEVQYAEASSASEGVRGL